MSNSNPPTFDQLIGKATMTIGPGEPPEYMDYHGTRYLPPESPAPHGQASVEDWLASKWVKITFEGFAGGQPEPWLVYWWDKKTGDPGRIVGTFPTYPSARDAAVAWVKEQEQQ